MVSYGFLLFMNNKNWFGHKAGDKNQQQTFQLSAFISVTVLYNHLIFVIFYIITEK